MDPTTQAHIDPGTLHSTGTGSDGVPSLGSQPTATTVPLPDSKDHHSAASAASTSPTATGLRQRVNNLGHQLEGATDHPAVQNAKDVAQKQVSSFRETLGRFPIVKDLEKRTGVDRVILVAGGALLYILLIPLNIFGLGLPTTTLLTLVPPAYLALGILESPQNEQSDAATRALLAYFVVLGFVQFLESLMANFLFRKIPQYYTVKLVFLAYLLHPRTQGAMKFHQAVLRPVLARAQAGAQPTTTPPQSKPSQSIASSPTFPSSAGVESSSASGLPPTNPFSPSSGSVDGQGNITKNQASGQGFDVVTELH